MLIEGVFNKERPTVTYVDKSICMSFDNQYNYRLEYLNKVLKIEPQLKSFFNTAPIVGDRKYVLVDIKRGLVKEGRSTCKLKNWHLDSTATLSFAPFKNSRFHIMEWGGLPTQFIGNPINYKGLPNLNQVNYCKYVLSNYIQSIHNIPEYCWNTYHETDWHRGPIAKQDTYRTFIRIVETDYLRPQGIKSKVIKDGLKEKENKVQE
jgi:hypothetical protein